MKIILTLIILVFSAVSIYAVDIPVHSGDNLQTKLNSATCGDRVLIDAATSYSGNFTLPNAGVCSSYITIQSTGTIPASGTKITQSFASQMAKLVSPNTLPALTNAVSANHWKLIGIEITNIGGSVVTEELVVIADVPTTSSFITFDRCWIHEVTNDTSTPDSITTTAIRGLDINASDITVVDCRIAGFRTYRPTPAGVEASNGILFPSSARRVSVTNNYIEAWFVPVFFGGSGGTSPNTATLSGISFNTGTLIGSATFSSVSNLNINDLVAFQVAGGFTPITNSAHPHESVVFQVGKVTNIAGSVVTFIGWGTYDGNVAGGNPLLQAPCACGLQSLPGGYTSIATQAQWNGYLNQDITIERNQFVENYNSTQQVFLASGNAPKGNIEIKMGINILINGNTFEGWGVGFVLTSRNQGSVSSSGGFPWFGLFNITISNNWWKRTINNDRPNGFPFGGPQLQDNEYSNVRSGPMLITNNLVEFGTSQFAQTGSADNVTITHNTYPMFDGAPGGGSMLVGQGANSNNLIYKDNIMSNNEYGLNCQSATNCWPGITATVGGGVIVGATGWNHNVIIDNRSSAGKAGDGPLINKYPNDNIAASQSAILWINQSTHNYRLASNSPYKNAASDGTDIGVNWANLVSALGFDPSGMPIVCNWNSSPACHEE